MSNIRLTKKFTFEMAHALYGYDGLCKNIHGHTYHLHVTVIGQPLKKNNHPKNGMVMDFSDLKKIVTEKILSRLDHALLLNANSPHKNINGLSDHFDKIIYTPYQPTCENMLLEFQKIIFANLPGKIKLHSIRLEETPYSFAEWHAADN